MQPHKKYFQLAVEFLHALQTLKIISFLCSLFAYMCIHLAVSFETKAARPTTSTRMAHSRCICIEQFGSGIHCTSGSLRNNWNLMLQCEFQQSHSNNTAAQEDQFKQSNTIRKEMDLSSEMKNLQVLSIDWVFSVSGCIEFGWSFWFCTSV